MDRQQRKAKSHRAGHDAPPFGGTDLWGRLGGSYICVAAFVAGASVMIVELTASRVLAPSFGNTLYTWTSLIGVVLVALSVGYYAGGRLADRYPTPKTLLHLISAAALCVLAVPILSRLVVAGLASEGQEVDIILGPLYAALLLFAVPGCLLGTVTPVCIKLLSQQTHNHRVGASAGTIAMLSTVGSVLGTFGAGFVLIPAVGARSIFVVVGLCLAVTAALGYAGLVGSRFRSPRSAGLVLIGAAVLGLASQLGLESAAQNVVFQKDTFYHRISVMRMNAPDGRGVTFLLTDGAAQGAQADEGEHLVYEYNRYYRLERLFADSVRRALFLGGGAYATPECLADDHPGAVVDVVEIDPEIERIARRFFRLDDYEGRVRPVVDDARRFLAASNERYDLIFGDVFRGKQTVPPHLVTREFFELIKRRLTADGVYMMNVIGALQGPRSRLFVSVAATLQDVFGELYVFAVHPNRPATQPQNLVLVAPKQQRNWNRMDLVERAGSDALVRMAGNLVGADLFDLSGATLLTDDFCPVEYLVACQLRD
jgi:spermidine synthase